MAAKPSCTHLDDASIGTRQILAGTVDVSNALNTVDLSLGAVRTQFPTIAQWAELCCATLSPAIGLCKMATSLNQRSLRLLFVQAHSGDLDMHAFYLVGGLLAGSAPAVKCFFNLEGCREDLAVSPEITPACTADQPYSAADFPGRRWNGSDNFKLLGAAVGSPEMRKLAESLGRQRPCEPQSDSPTHRGVVPQASLRSADCDLRTGGLPPSVSPQTPRLAIGCRTHPSSPHCQHRCSRNLQIALGDLLQRAIVACEDLRQ